MRTVLEGHISTGEAAVALEDFRDLDVQRHSHEPLLDRVWALRDTFTAYDAVYVALAEVLDAQVLTCDGPFSRAPMLKGRVILVQTQILATT